jgi:two-component system chemotaxis response regulator CheY
MRVTGAGGLDGESITEDLAMTILLVDDELEYRMLLRTVLMNRGVDVLLAENGLEGLDKLRGGMRVDLVLTDIYMPVMDGIKMSRALRAIPEFATVPILYLSGYDDQHTLDAVKDPRYEGFLRKGSPLDEMLLWIDYLTTPLEKRPKSIPKGTQTRINLHPRDGSRTYTNIPLL